MKTRGELPVHRITRGFRFDRWTLDANSGELGRDGTWTRLQHQPFEFLMALLERPGEVVTRQELEDRLWPNGTFVDFEHGLNAALKRLRGAIGDSASRPRFIETLPRRGYRLIAAVEVIGALGPGAPLAYRSSSSTHVTALT